MSRAYPTGEDVAAFLSRSVDSAFVDYCDIVVQAASQGFSRVLDPWSWL